MHNGTCAVTLDTFWNEMPSMSELQVAGRDTCIIFLTAAEIFPGVVSTSGSNAREPPRRRRRLDLTVRALMKIQLRNEVVLTMKNVDSQISPFRAVCTIPDFKVRRTLLGLMWCDIKALTQLTQHNMFFLYMRLGARPPVTAAGSSIFLKPAAFIHVSHQSDRFSIWWYTTPNVLAERLAE